jgi:hypothetical protein
MVKVYLTCGGSPLIHSIRRAVKVFLIFLFLSSGAAHALGTTETLPRDLDRGSDYRPVLFNMPAVAPPTDTFSTAHPPVMYVMAWPRVPTEAEKLCQAAYVQLLELMHQPPPQEAVKATPTWHYFLPAIGALLLLMAVAQERWKVLN